MAVLRMSFVNLAACGDVTTCATVQSSGFCSSQAQAPQRPFLPWRTTTTTAAQAVVFDFGAATAIDLFFVNRTNFATIRLQGDNTSTWSGAVNYDSTNVTVTRNPYTGRYQYLHCSTGFNHRYLRVLIPSQDKVLEQETDSAVEYFLVGGVWAGASTNPPNHLRVPAEVRVEEPRLDVGPFHQGWEQRLRLGAARTVLTASRLVGATPATPALSDDWRTALGVDRRMRERDVFLVDLNLSDPSQAWVMRRRSDLLWRFGGAVSESLVEFAEVVGP